MPLGLRQNNNLLHLTLDIWQEQIFFNEAAYPSGYFAAEILNVNDETLRELFTHGGGISHQMCRAKPVCQIAAGAPLFG